MMTYRPSMAAACLAGALALAPAAHAQVPAAAPQGEGVIAKAEITAALASPWPVQQDLRHRTPPADVVQALANARGAVAAAGDAADAIQRAIHAGREPTLDASLAGALGGALWGAAALPAERIAALARVEDIERLAGRLIERQRSLRAPERVSL